MKFADGYKPFDFSENPMTVGIEVEFIASMEGRKNIDLQEELIDPTKKWKREREERGRIREGFAKVIQRRVQKEFPHIKAHIKMLEEYRKVHRGYEYEYLIHYELNGQKYEYAVMGDSTIQFPPRHMGVELKSPKFYTQQDINLFYDILRLLKVEREIKTTQTAGVHVHIGFPEARPQEVAMAISLFSAFEKQIYSAFSVLPERRQEYAQFTGDKVLSFLQQTDSDALTIENIDKNVDHRNHGLNIAPLRWRDTVEFRLFNSSVHPERIHFMVAFAQSFIRSVREKNPQLLKWLSENGNLESLSFEQFIEAIGLEAPSLSPVVLRRASATR